jgi:hypothetical protein
MMRKQVIGGTIIWGGREGRPLCKWQADKVVMVVFGVLDLALASDASHSLMKGQFVKSKKRGMQRLSRVAMIYK